MRNLLIIISYFAIAYFLSLFLHWFLHKYKRTLLNNVLLRSFWTAIIALLFGWCVSRTSDIMFPAFSLSLSDDTYITGYFKCFNNDEQEQDPNWDIKLYDSRNLGIEEAAPVIDSIVKCRPKVLGIDIIWPDTSGVRKEHYERLSEVIHNANNEMRAYGGFLFLNSEIEETGYLKKSFFIDDKLERTLTFANIEGMNLFFPKQSSVIRKYRSSDSVSNEIVFFPYRIASAYLNKDINELNNLGINYLNKNPFDKYTCLEDICVDSLENRIVLVGDSRDSKDNHKLPCRFNHKTSIDGLNWNAYMINTLISPQHDKVPKTDRPYKKASFLADLPGLVLLYLYCIISVVLSIEAEKKNKYSIFISIGKPFFMIIYANVVLYLCYCWTYFTMTVPDLFMYLLAIVFIEFACKIVEPTKHD